MKKLLGILGGIGLAGTASATVVACANKSVTDKTDYSELKATIEVANLAIIDNNNPNENAEVALNAEINVAQSIVNQANSDQTEVDREVIKLETAIQEFKAATATDYSKLISAISEAQAAIKDNVNPNKNAEVALNAEIDDAQRVADNEKAAQVEVDNATQKLTTAIQIFRDATEVDYTNLIEAIANAKKAIVNNVNPNEKAEAALRVAIAIAQKVIDDVNGVQAQVDDATSDLVKATTAFIKATATDYSKLISAISEAQAAIKDNVNPNEKAEATLKTAIFTAERTINNPKATQAKVDDTIEMLERAIRTFKVDTATNYSQLKATIVEAKVAIANNKNSNLEAEATLNAAIDVAQKMVDETQSNQIEVDRAVTTLNAAIRTFRTATHTDYSQLISAIAVAKQAIADNINPNLDAEATLTAAINVAQKMVDKANSSQKEVDRAVTTLNAAIQTFKVATHTDYSQLTATITEAKQAIIDNVNPNEEAEATLNAAIDVAQTVADNDKATQVEVDQAIKKLEMAIRNFKAITDTDYSQLEATITEAKQAIADNVNPNPDADAMLNVAIDVAQRVADNEKATQKDVDRAVTTLNVAIKHFRSVTNTDFSQLRAAITTAQTAIDKNVNPNPGAEATLKAEIDAAQRMVDEAKASQAEVIATTTDLLDATVAFTEATATDYSQLRAAITTAQTAIDKNINPNAEAEAVLNAAIDVAKNIIKQGNWSQKEVNSAVTKLETAIKDFQTATATDYSRLTAAIQAAYQAIAENVNPNANAEATLKTEINIAEKVADNHNATQVAVDQAVTKLNAAIQTFKTRTATDYSKLIEAIDAAKQAIAENVNPNPNAEATLNSAIGEAQNIVEQGSSNQQEVIIAITTLEKATAAFIKATTTDYSKLIEAIDNAEYAIGRNKNPNAEAEATLKTEISIAQTVADSNNATQVAVDQAVTKLNAAIRDFKNATATDYSKLVATITEAQNAIDNNVHPNEKAEAALRTAISRAQTVAKNAYATQAEVDNATQALRVAIQKFKDATRADWTDLIETIQRANQAIADKPGTNDPAEKALRKVLDATQNIVDQAKADQVEVDNANTALKVAINDFEKAMSLYKKLVQKIKEAEEIRKGTVDEWTGPSRYSLKKLDARVDLSYTYAKNLTLNDKGVTDEIKGLEEAVNAFKLSLPGNIIAEAINREQDIQNRVDKNWTYEEFWTNENDPSDSKSKRLTEILTTSVADIARNQGYSEAEIASLQSEINDWTKDNVKLVYIDIDANGAQVVKEIITSDEKGTLEEIFLNKVKANHPDELDENGNFKPGFWEDASRGGRLSLGISFAKDAEGHTLGEETKDFWTFTFAGELGKDDFKEIAIERNAEGNIILNVKKGLSKKDFWNEISKELIKSLFYDRCLIPQGMYCGGWDYVDWNRITDDQINNGGEISLAWAQTFIYGPGWSFFVSLTNVVVNIY